MSYLYCFYNLLLFFILLLLYISLFIVLCVFLYFIITAALCVLINGWMDGLHVRGALCRCTVIHSFVNLKQKQIYIYAGTQKLLPDTLRIAGSSMTSLWRPEAAWKKSVTDTTRISCFVTTMKLLHTLQIYSTVSVKKCAVSFFKVLQLQTIGKVGNLIMCLWADNFRLQQWKNY